MRKKTLLLTLVVAPLFADGPRADAQAILERVTMKGTPLPLGDLDGDGVRDILVREPTYDVPTLGGAGKVTILSGADLSWLHAKTGTGVAQRLGYFAARMGDVDGDGVPDYFVGDLPALPPGSPGRAVLTSGATHAAIAAFPCDAGVDRIGDVDQDGVDDFAVQIAGKLEVRSGADGALIRTDDDSYGARITALGDADGDGVDDYGVALDGADHNGVVHVVSGATGVTHLTISGVQEHALFGRDLAAAGDLDDDGHADLLLGAKNKARAYSGKKGAPLFTWKAPAESGPYAQFGWSVEGNVDVDDDGVPDALVSAPDHHQKQKDGKSYGKKSGRVFAYSGATGKRLFDVWGASTNHELGLDLLSMGDRDGDGISDAVFDRIDGFVIVAGRGADVTAGTTVLAKISAHDFDEVFIYGLKGMKLKARASLDAGNVNPRVSVRRANDELVKALDFDDLKDGAPGPQTVKLKKHALHRLRIVSLDKTSQTLGDVRIEFDVTYPKAAKARSVDRKAKAGQTLVAEVALLPGATLNTTVELKKGFTTTPALTVRDPHGVELDVAPYVTAEPGLLHLVGLPVTEVGVHRLEVPAGPTGKSKVTFHLDPVQPPPGQPADIN